MANQDKGNARVNAGLNASFRDVMRTLPIGLGGVIVLAFSLFLQTRWPHYFVQNKEHASALRLVDGVGFGAVGVSAIFIFSALAKKWRKFVPSWYGDLRTASAMDPVFMLAIAALSSFGSTSSHLTTDVIGNFFESAPGVILYPFFMLRASRRARAYKLLTDRNALLLFLWAALMLVYTTSTYAGLTSFFVSFHLLSFQHAQVPIPNTTFEMFYIWHFVTDIPVLDLTDTLNWHAPLTYTSLKPGILVIAYMVTVAAPLVSVASEWIGGKKDRDEKKQPQPPNNERVETQADSLLSAQIHTPVNPPLTTPGPGQPGSGDDSQGTDVTSDTA
jgi:hypothetical protein